MAAICLVGYCIAGHELVPNWEGFRTAIKAKNGKLSPKTVWVIPGADSRRYTPKETRVTSWDKVRI